jgi:ubiquinone biosynthesis protein Coq4
MTITMGSGCNPLIGFLWTSMVKQDLQNGLKRLKVSLESPEG